MNSYVVLGGGREGLLQRGWGEKGLGREGLLQRGGW